MNLREINPTDVYDGSPYGISQAVVDERSGHIFISGQVAWDVNGRVQGSTYGEQTRFALHNLAAVLRSAGCGASDVIAVRFYMRGEMADNIQECLPALGAFFGKKRPALTGLGVASLATPDTLVEIEVTAQVQR